MSQDHLMQWEGKECSSEPSQMVSSAGASHSMHGHAKQTWLGAEAGKDLLPPALSALVSLLPQLEKSILARVVEDLLDSFIILSSLLLLLLLSVLLFSDLCWFEKAFQLASPSLQHFRAVLLALFCLDSLPSLSALPASHQHECPETPGAMLLSLPPDQSPQLPTPTCCHCCHLSVKSPGFLHF